MSDPRSRQPIALTLESTMHTSDSTKPLMTQKSFGGPVRSFRGKQPVLTSNPSFSYLENSQQTPSSTNVP